MLRELKEMRKSIFYLCLGLLMGFRLFSQDQKEDLIRASIVDTRNPQVLDSIAQGLLQYPEDSQLIGRAYFLKGMANTYRANPKLAAVDFRKSLAYLEEGASYDDRFSYDVVLKNLGIAAYRNRNASLGDSCFKALRKMALEKGDSLKYAVAQKAIANALMMRRSYDSAAVILSEVAQIQQNIQYPGLASTYLSLGSLYGRMHLEEEALKWLRKASMTSLAHEDQRLMGRIYNNMSVAHRAIAQYDSATILLNRALRIQEATGSALDQLEVRANLARNYALLDRWDSANHHLKVAYHLLPDSKAGGISRTNLWLLSLQIANHNKDLESSAAYVDSIRTVVSQQQIFSEVDLLDAFAHFFELSGAQDSAYRYLKQSNVRHAELEALRDAARVKWATNEIELAALEQELVQDLKGYQMALLVVFSFLIIGGAWLWYARRKVKSIQREKLESQVPQPSFSLVDEHNPVKSAPTEKAVEEPKAPTLHLKSKALIDIEKLDYLQSDGHYVNFHLSDRARPEVERSSLKTWEEQLSNYGFVRIHRSYLVSLKALKAVYASKVLLNDGTELPVSRTYKEDLQLRFKGE